MPTKGAKHQKDGERCGLCFEEWPCEGRRTGLSGVQQWKLQTELVLSQERIKSDRERRADLCQLIQEGLALLDLDLGHVFDRAYPMNGVMIKLEDLALLIQKAIDNDTRYTEVG